MSTVGIIQRYGRTRISQSEEAHLEGVIMAIKDSGANVVVASGSISDMALHFLEKHKLAAFKVPSKWELRRLCISTGATAMVRLGGATPEEMGTADLVEVRNT
jgi:T-complex protein 1 subunit theta